jgi:hypothetical protein
MGGNKRGDPGEFVMRAALNARAAVGLPSKVGVLPRCARGIRLVLRAYISAAWPSAVRHSEGAHIWPTMLDAKQN